MKGKQNNFYEKKKSVRRCIFKPFYVNLATVICHRRVQICFRTFSWRRCQFDQKLRHGHENRNLSSLNNNYKAIIATKLKVLSIYVFIVVAVIEF